MLAKKDPIILCHLYQSMSPPMIFHCVCSLLTGFWVNLRRVTEEPAQISMD